ncbi:M56 family metallopeptidase [Humisphaera borealis]|uniref:Peptidase M56 domain-containing protein n=1 Tax=Humisphaera borealis TaxID=2807512 RepID=A0A7M2WV00_9BACT|nr:M56 family metallopeptidase [Humisphaera borealis]QOV89042.1 hypothetical protein IPV69_22910 [Humisphaera borealis]
MSWPTTDALLSTDQALFAVSLSLAVIVAGGLGLGLAWLTRRRPAPLRYGLMLSSLGIAVLSPLLTVISQQAKLGWLRVTPPDVAPAVHAAEHLPASAAFDGETLPPAVSAKVVAVAPSMPAIPWTRVIATALIAVWILGALISLWRIGWGVVRLRRFILTLRPCEDRAATALLRRAAELLALRRRPAMLVSDALPVPMVIGLRRPIVVLPAQLPRRLDTEKLEAVLLHETAHIAHGDLWVGLFQRLAGAAFWWCPLIHSLNRRISDLREDICDNYVLNVQGDGLKLAEVLVDLAELAQSRHWKPFVCAMGAIDERPGLERRITRLLQRRNTMTRMNRMALVGTLGSGLLIGGAILATTVRAADEAKPADDTAASKPATGAATMLSAPDFWEKTGADTRHDFSAETANEIRRVAADKATSVLLRVRAMKLACDLAGDSRSAPTLSAEDVRTALSSAMSHLEKNLADETIGKFAAEMGFTHVIVSPKTNDDGTWVLIESIDEARRGGLNIRVDRKTSKVTKVDHWGKVTERLVPPAAEAADQPFTAKIALRQTDAAKTTTTLQATLKGTAGKPWQSQLSGKLKQTVDLTIVALPQTQPQQYSAAFKITEGDNILSAPRLTVLDNQAGSVTIQMQDGSELSIEVTIASGRLADRAIGHAPAAAVVPAPRFVDTEEIKVAMREAARRLLELDQQIEVARQSLLEGHPKLVALKQQAASLRGQLDAMKGQMQTSVALEPAAAQAPKVRATENTFVVRTAELELVRARVRASMLDADEQTRRRGEAQLSDIDVQQAELNVVQARTRYETATGTRYDLRRAELELARAKATAAATGADESTRKKIAAQLADIDVQLAELVVERARLQYETGIGGKGER